MSDAVVSAINGQIALRLPRRALRMLVYLLVATIAVLTVSLMSGSYPLSPVQVWDTLFTTAPSDIASTVVWEFRFPRVLVAFFVGAFLALSGATLQYVTRNPLADPSLVGVSQGAALAVVSVTILSPETDVFLRPLVAFAGSLAVAALILLASSSQRAASTLRFILMGIGVAALISALTSALLTYGDINRAMTALGWLAGSVHTVGWNEVCWLAVTGVFVLPGLFAAARPLSAIRFGEDVATGLGVRIHLARWALIGLSVALAATAVAAVGPLGFVGLVAPHLARRLAPSGVGLHLCLTALTGALLVALADLVGRVTFAPLQIPAGLVTAMIGVPVFIALILRSQSRTHL